MTLFALLDQTATRYATRGALYRGSELVMTWADLRERALRLAAALREYGEIGDRVVVASKNDPELIVVMFAAWAAGMAFAPLNAKLHPREMAEVIADAGARWVFVGDDLAATLAGQPGLAARIVAISGPAYAAMLEAAPMTPAAVVADDLAWLFYTSGTTGRSKGAMLSHRNLLAMTASHLADFEDLCADDSLIHAAPMSHGSGLCALPYVARGARQVVPAGAGFDAGEFLDLCDAHSGCGAFLAPTMVQRLRLEAEARGAVPAGLRSIIYGGGPMYLDEIRRSLARFGPLFRHLYGQGETPMTITGLRRRDFDERSDHVIASVGWPRTGMEVRIVDADGTTVADDVVGEIVCRGDVVMRGYWRDPAATAAALRDGWLHTGDLGSRDATGMITLSDRSKEVIISGGSNIYPREVEDVLLAHPGVREVAVLGRSDPEWGEIVIAFVACEPDVTVTEGELDRLCIERIARFKRPKQYHFLDDLPKSSYGKILKRELAALAA